MKIEKRYRVSLRVNMVPKLISKPIYTEIFESEVVGPPDEKTFKELRGIAQNYPHCHVHVEEYYYVE